MEKCCIVQEDMAELSAHAAGERATEVYMGVDVFGRNTFGGGGWDVGFLPSEFIL
jgi:mannosyl-glycoprotein endo-beta-N-acetylglucosaminidase